MKESLMKITDMRESIKRKRLEIGDVITQKQGVWMVIKIHNLDRFGLVNLRNGMASSAFYKSLSDLEEFAINDEVVDAELFIK
jgi:hypothetical protein